MTVGRYPGGCVHKREGGTGGSDARGIDRASDARVLGLGLEECNQRGEPRISLLDHSRPPRWQPTHKDQCSIEH